MSAKAIMVQGTASYAGKSFLTMALCRIFANRGCKVAPFKAQNTSLNSYVTKDGREIARAQALQALAARIEPSVEMNPILLKPKGDAKMQIVAMGKPLRDFAAWSYYEDFVLEEGIKIIKSAYKKLSGDYDLIVIEGAGSPAEINLYERDVANMRIAEIANAPVILVADIDRGGVFASIYGTVKLLPARHRKRIRGVVINKFRGDIKLLKPGIEMIEKLVHKPTLGVLPYIKELRLPSEDSVSLEEVSLGIPKSIEIAVIKFPHISNFTDFDMLAYEGASLRYVESAEQLGSPSVVILPGTKNTVQDLLWLRRKGLDKKIAALRGKVPILGICGGYQMLGKKIVDAKGLEGGKKKTYAGLGLLDVTTNFESYTKQTKRVVAKVIASSDIFSAARGSKIQGYEIHMGRTRLGSVEAIFEIQGRKEGACSGLVAGTYLHGLFDSPALRNALFDFLHGKKAASKHASQIWDESIERAASIVEKSLDMKRIEEIAGL